MTRLIWAGLLTSWTIATFRAHGAFWFLVSAGKELFAWWQRRRAMRAAGAAGPETIFA